MRAPLANIEQQQCMDGAKYVIMGVAEWAASTGAVGFLGRPDPIKSSLGHSIYTAVLNATCSRRNLDPPHLFSSSHRCHRLQFGTTGDAHINQKHNVVRNPRG